MTLLQYNRYCLKRVNIFLWIVVFICWFELHAQCDGGIEPDNLSWDFDEDKDNGFSLGSFISDIFTPRIITDTRRIREYVIDERFQVLRNQCGDMRTIDAIYLKALKIAEYNIARALFLSMTAVLEHRNINLNMPILQSMKIPLTFESDSVFSARIHHLPNHFLKDSSNTAEGDRDKLQHFFGSAYLAYVSEAPELTRTTGNLIEWGEAKFIVGGADDERDKRINRQGGKFGRDLLIVKTLLPSDYLTFPHEDSK